METSRAIVLRNEYPVRSRLLLFDEKQGVISCRSDRTGLAIGSFIDYTCVPSGAGHNAQSVNVLALPQCEQLADLLFFHRVLEICGQFIPEGDQAIEAFWLMQFLYDPQCFSCLRNSLLKKIFLCKIFIVLGVWPAGEKFQNPFFYRLAAESIDNLLGLSIQLKDEYELDGWLQMCIATHPRAQNFKTWHFSRETK